MIWTASLRRICVQPTKNKIFLRDQWKALSTTVPVRTESEAPPKPLDLIPEKPSLASPEDAVSSLETVSSSLGDTLLGEPSFQSLGLAKWTPPGLLQWAMENLHCVAEMPWWVTIVATTCALRLAVFPLVVFSQKNASRLNQNMPEMSHIQARLSEARKRGDLIEVQKWSMELQSFMKEKQIQPVKNFIPMVIQVPIFMSMFFALRGMSNLPVESMMTGGLSWFGDLTLSDPYYILPVFVSGTFFLQIYFAVDGANYQTMGVIGKTVCKVIPLVMFPLIMSFPSAMTLYWATTNVISVAQVKLIRQPRVRKLCGIPDFVEWSKKKDKFNSKDKGFKDSVKDAMDNWKVQRDVMDRRAFDEQVFREAGNKRKRRTYKFNPTAPMLTAKDKQ